MPQLSAAIALVGGISQQLQERKAEALAQISAAFEDLEQALQQRKQALVSDLETICGAKQKVGLLTLPHPASLDDLIAFIAFLPCPSPPFASCVARRCHRHLCLLSSRTVVYFFHATAPQVHQ